MPDIPSFGHLNAMRYTQKPIGQPNYAFLHVPFARGSLEGSKIERIENREHFQACMAEMLLLGKEAARRRKRCKVTDAVVTDSAAKPLSLEYIADRLDVDEPCFGFLVRTKTPPESYTEPVVVSSATAQAPAPATNSATVAKVSKDVSTVSSQPQPQSFWKEGMLQGFITVTTFTNWQKTFRWDSLHPEAYGFDPPALIAQRKNGTRKCDLSGELSNQLQQTVHMGNVWKQGVVWPRLAEISLLGGLGCGKTLVKLAIEHLESLKASAEQNYDYVVLQATDNSVPFYEQLGFVRVGGIMEEKMQNEEPSAEIVTSPVTTYKTSQRGERLRDIAKKVNSDVYDIIFLNKDAIPNITPNSRLLVNTTLQVPVTTTKKEQEAPTPTMSARCVSPTSNKEETSGDTGSIPKPRTVNNPQVEKDSDGVEWHIALENDTPTKIARMYNVKCQDLISANAARLPGLISKSRLKHGTRVQVSHLHVATKVWTAYSHWSFPDDKTEPGEPSYMMVYKLASRSKRKSSARPTHALLKIDIEDYTPAPLIWPPLQTETMLPKEMGGLQRKGFDRPNEAAADGKKLVKVLAKDTNSDALVKVKVLSCGESVKPSPQQRHKKAVAGLVKLKGKRKPAVGSFVLFCQDMRNRKQGLLEGLSIADASRVLADRWRFLPQKTKEKFDALAKEKLADNLEQEEDKRQQPQGRNSLESPQSHTGDESKIALSKIANKKKDHNVLYNKIVKILPEALPFTVTVMPTDEEVFKAGADRSDDPTACPSMQPEKYEYWYVLTYIPDLQWCHLVPLVAASTFTVNDKKPSLIGKTKWKLVNEKLNQEIDISSQYVVPVKSRETKKSANADKEEWAIFEGEDCKESVKSKAVKRKRCRSSSPPKLSSVKKQPPNPQIPQPTPVRQESSCNDRPSTLNTVKVKTVEEADLDATVVSASNAVQGGKLNVEFQMTLPPMDLDLSLLQRTALNKYDSDSNASNSPPVSNNPCPVQCLPQFHQVPHHCHCHRHPPLTSCHCPPPANHHHSIANGHCGFQEPDFWNLQS